jgi:hypothetical protein
VKRTPARDMFDSLIKKEKNGCHVWTGGKTRLGYGHFWSAEQKLVYAHRVSYERKNGKIPDGLELDHLCRNPSCVNPEHLEAVDHRTNLLRGEGIASIHSKKTHCKHGHPYAGENLYISPKGYRKCYICASMYDQKRRKKNAA